MVAAWGGYVFIINIIPIYTVVMIVGGRYSNRLYVAYSVFYTLGSLMAMTVPFVGFNVINQAECAASHGVFIAVQVFALASHIMGIVDAKLIRRLFTTLALGVVAAVAFALISMQLMGKLQWTGRSLTLLDPTYASKYIPIIASVSEHQPTTWSSFFFDLHILVPLAPVGLFFMFSNITDGGIFVILYGTLAWYFAGVMVRLMLTLAPIACVLAAIGLSTIITRFSAIIKTSMTISLDANLPTNEKVIVTDSPSSSNGDMDGSLTGDRGVSVEDAGNHSDGMKGVRRTQSPPVASSLALMILAGAALLLISFSYHATFVASVAYSSPSIVIDAGRGPDGRMVMYDDYREAYFWLRMNTHPDAKILSWWDYGYQMSAMANRTVLVDNNTWNNTHIATVGRALATTEEEAYPILQSLDVDYVLVIFGGVTGYSSDDINKFLWPVRIGSGVYPNDMPSERDYLSAGGAFDIGPGGSPTLQNCVAYKLCYYRFGQLHTEYGKPTGYDRARQREIGKKNIELTTMEEAFTSEHWIVRIYKVKKRPNLDPTPNAKKQAKKLKQKGSSGGSTGAGDEARYVGCYPSENMFIDKVYDGGSTGANYNLALHHAKSQRRRYFAMSRNGDDGHAFAFSSLDTSRGKALTGGGCDRPCLDVEAKICGCMDNSCTGPTPRGEQHNRRWAVYEITSKK
jgi:dolichyl-diphosphooligosaccharide--protein glycosyltransferase